MLRTSRAVRLARLQLTRRQLQNPTRIHARFESTGPQAAKTEGAKAGGSAGLIGGLAGGAVVLGLGYSYYHFSGAKTAVNSISDAKSYLENATKQLKPGNLQPSETIQWLRSTASSYAMFIPGGRAIVDKGFTALDELQESHGDELNKLIGDAHSELIELTQKGGLDAASAKKAWDILVKYLSKFEQMAEDVGQEFLQKHPQLKEQYGDKLQKLKELGEKQGGDAKKYADETWSQIQKLVAGGGLDKDKIGKVLQDGIDKAQSYGEDAWNQAMKTAKPYLDKNPELKKIIEENGDKLKKGDFAGLVSKLQDAAKSGDVSELKEYAEEKLQQAKGMSEDAYKGAMARASLYLDKYPELKKIVEQKSDVLKKIDFEKFMDKLREAGKTGDIQPVQDFVEKEAQKLQD